MRAAAATAVAAVTHNQINFYFYINSFLSLLLIVVCLSDRIYHRLLHTRVLQTLLFRFIRPIGIRSKQTQQDTGETTPATKPVFQWTASHCLSGFHSLVSPIRKQKRESLPSQGQQANKELLAPSGRPCVAHQRQQLWDPPIPLWIVVLGHLHWRKP